ncbi:MAG: ABC transporter ATP-binding protein [Bacteroidales bacterium]|nr:ABC transporter ATP-binding protein [Bacteroidales bacterium]
MVLSLQNICKSFNGKEIFKDFNIQFTEGIITCILGPSGCGKTTLLNLIGGILHPDSGRCSGFTDRKISYIFQEPRLLPWKTVRGNIEFVLPDELASTERKEKADELIRRVNLCEFADYYPGQLSGGMKQRVSIARAFASSSDIILMDEPLNGLDFSLKQNMLKWFSQIWQADRRTVIFVTHDIDEALAIGNEVYVFSQAPVKVVSHHVIDSSSTLQLKNEIMKNL